MYSTNVVILFWNILIIVLCDFVFNFRKFIEMGFIDKDRIAMWGWVSAMLSLKTKPSKRFKINNKSEVMTTSQKFGIMIFLMFLKEVSLEVSSAHQGYIY